MSSDSSQSHNAIRSLTAWLLALVAGSVVSAVVVNVAGYVETPISIVPTWVTATSVFTMWIAMLFVMGKILPVSPRLGRESVGWFSTSDLKMGIPLGIASQLFLVNAVNWPLQKIWPDVFSFDQVSQRATDLADAARGGWIFILFTIVVLGAPLVEELIYRGILQPAFISSMGRNLGIGLVAVLFAAIHWGGGAFPEFPGLLAFALVLGTTRYRTGRLGLPIITHMAFNATGLALVILT